MSSFPFLGLECLNPKLSNNLINPLLVSSFHWDTVNVVPLKCPSSIMNCENTWNWNSWGNLQITSKNFIESISSGFNLKDLEIKWTKTLGIVTYDIFSLVGLVPKETNMIGKNKNGFYQIW